VIWRAIDPRGRRLTAHFSALSAAREAVSTTADQRKVELMEAEMVRTLWKNLLRQGWRLEEAEH